MNIDLPPRSASPHSAPASMDIDEQLATDTQHPIMAELRQWRDAQRAPLSNEEKKELYAELWSAMSFYMRAAIKAQLGIVLSNQLLILCIGIAIGYVAGRL